MLASIRPEAINAPPPLLGTTTAAADGTFQLELNLPEGGYILAATAEKSGLLSGYSNQPAINVDHHLPLDPDQVDINADGVDMSSGCVQAERRILPYQQLAISAVVNCCTFRRTAGITRAATA